MIEHGARCACFECAGERRNAEAERRLKTDGRWLGRLMHLARVAQTWSKDPDERVGAAIASPDFLHQSLGYNGLPEGMDDDALRSMTKAEKDEHMRHAERNLLERLDRPIGGWSLAVTKAPCLDCAELIVTRGIKRVVVSQWPYNTSRWYASQMQAFQMFKHQGVELWLEGLGTLTCPVHARRFEDHW